MKYRIAVGGQAGLPGKEGRYRGMTHRLKGVVSKGAFSHRNAVYIVDTVSCNPSDLRKGRQKRKLSAVAGLEQGG